MAEGGAGGKEVGRISIRVVPNTDRFRADLQRQLDEIEKGSKFKVRIDPDMDGFRDKVDAATRNLKDAKVKVKTEFDRKGDLIHDLDRAMDDAGKRAKLDVTPNIQQSSFQKALRDVKTQAKLADVKLDVDFKDKEAEGRLKALITRLKAIAKAEDIKVKVKTERSSLGGLFGGGSGGAGSAASAGGNGASMGLRLLTDQTALIAVAIVALLAPALSLLSTALVSLPALITAVALPIGVFALGLGGIKKALDDSGILSETKGKKGKEKQGLGEALKEVQQQISDVFEKGFTPLFRQVALVIPSLTRGLPFIAQGIVNFATGVVRAVSSVPNLQMFDRLTNSVGTMMTNLTPGITAFTNGMIRLTTDVGDHLPGLGNFISGWADKFSNWVAKIDKPKQDWFKQDIPNSSTLDQAVTNLKPTLDSILSFVGQLMTAGLKMSDPKMAENIKTVISSLGDFITNSLPDLVTGFASIAKVAKELGIISGTDNGKPGKNPDGSPKPTDKPGPGHPRTNSPFSFTTPNRDGSWLGPDSKSWIPKLFRPDGLDQIFSNLGGLLKTVWGSLGTGQAGAAPAPFNPGSKAQQPAAPAAAPSGDGGAGGLGSKVTGQIQGVKDAVGPALAGIADGSDKVWDKLVEATKAAGSAIVGQVQSWVGQIQGALAGLGPAGSAAGQALSTGMAAGIAAGASSAIAAATALAQGVENAAKTHLGIKSPSKVFHGIGQDTAQGFQDGLEGGFQGVLDSAHSLAQQVADAVKGGTAGSGLGAQVKDQLKAITVEQDQLRAQKDGTADKGQKKAIQGQMDQLNVAKSQLQAQSSQLGYSEKYGNSQADSTKQQEAQLDLQQKQLKAQYDATSDPAKRRDLKAQMDNIKAQKDALKLQDDGKGGADKTDKTTQMLGQSVNKMVDIGKGFAMANVNQFESDIGISGHGAIPTIANIGLDWATSMLGNLASGLIGGGKGGGATHIHVNSIDEGLAAKQTLENRQALTNSAGR